MCLKRYLLYISFARGLRRNTAQNSPYLRPCTAGINTQEKKNIIEISITHQIEIDNVPPFPHHQSINAIISTKQTPQKGSHTGKKKPETKDERSHHRGRIPILYIPLRTHTMLLPFALWRTITAGLSGCAPPPSTLHRRNLDVGLDFLPIFHYFFLSFVPLFFFKEKELFLFFVLLLI